MSKTRKAQVRGDISLAVDLLKSCETEMRFWFNHRHTYTYVPDGFVSGYQFARHKFYRLKSNRKVLRRRLARLSKNYVSLYADN